MWDDNDDDTACSIRKLLLLRSLSLNDHNMYTNIKNIRYPKKNTIRSVGISCLLFVLANPPAAAYPAPASVFYNKHISCYRIAILYTYSYARTPYYNTHAHNILS